MSKHTPGPWRVDDDAYERCTVRAVEDEAYIADCCDGFYNDDGDYIRAGTVEANARLIAAAPELLAALQFVMSAHGEQLDLAFDQARAAIAKATGEQA